MRNRDFIVNIVVSVCICVHVRTCIEKKKSQCASTSYNPFFFSSIVPCFVICFVREWCYTMRGELFVLWRCDLKIFIIQRLAMLEKVLLSEDDSLFMTNGKIVGVFLFPKRPYLVSVS